MNERSTDREIADHRCDLMLRRGNLLGGMQRLWEVSEQVRSPKYFQQVSVYGY